MIQDIKELVYTYKADLASLEITSMKYKALGDRLGEMYTRGRFDMLRIVRRSLTGLIRKNEGGNEAI